MDTREQILSGADKTRLVAVPGWGEVTIRRLTVAETIDVYTGSRTPAEKAALSVVFSCLGVDGSPLFRPGDETALAGPGHGVAVLTLGKEIAEFNGLVGAGTESLGKVCEPTAGDGSPSDSPATSA